MKQAMFTAACNCQVYFRGDFPPDQPFAPEWADAAADNPDLMESEENQKFADELELALGTENPELSLVEIAEREGLEVPELLIKK